VIFYLILDFLLLLEDSTRLIVYNLFKEIMDPARAKVDQYSNATAVQQPISAQPISQPYGGTVATPIVVQSQGYGQQGYGQQGYAQQGYPPQAYPNLAPQAAGGGPMNPLFMSNGRQYPQGRWGDSICDWPANMYPSCYCVCCVCCGMYLAAQSKEFSPFFFLAYFLSPSGSKSWIF
jgi:hypothetical protein